jgi:hypothetical protein
MSTSTYTPRRAATVRISAQRDRVARALLIVAAFGAAIATVGAIGTASDADARHARRRDLAFAWS